MDLRYISILTKGYEVVANSSVAISNPVRDCIWLNLKNSRLKEQISNALSERVSSDIVTSSDLPEGSTVSIVVVDESSLDRLQIANINASVAMQSILLSAEKVKKPGIDFVLRPDINLDSLYSVLRAARNYRDQVVQLRAEIFQRTSAIGTIKSGTFIYQNLDEARNLAIMLALACPDSDLVAIGLMELLVNAVEHGNLDIHSKLKQELLIKDGWREEVERRLALPEYRDRYVSVTFFGSERMISISIQDQGKGFDHASYSGDQASSDYRGRGIAIARGMSFSDVSYSGNGTVAEATIMLNKKDPD